MSDLQPVPLAILRVVPEVDIPVVAAPAIRAVEDRSIARQKPSAFSDPPRHVGVFAGELRRAIPQTHRRIV